MRSFVILRNILGLSSSALASELGVTTSHYSRVEHGAVRPSDALKLRTLDLLEAKLPCASSARRQRANGDGCTSN